MAEMRCALHRVSMLVLLLGGWVSMACAGVYHVAPDGDDANSGTARATAWRTVNHAAGQVRAGDTVLIAGGTYREAVRILATGDEGRPITFKAAPGEKVVFDGNDRTLKYAFHVAYKSHLRFDGLYFVGYNGLGNYELPWSDHLPGNGDSGVMALYRCRDVQITRCFSDGRGPGYAASLVIARDCEDLLIRNCVISSAMGGGVHILYSPNARVEHNVFLVNLIYATVFQNRDNQPASLKHNIFTDNIESKFHVRLLYNSNPVDAGTANNCFFVRALGDRRAWDQSGTMGEWIAALATKHTHDESNNQIVADPSFKGALGVNLLNRRGEPMFLADYLLGKADLDFPDLFATNPEVLRRGIGLQPEAFGDFHFANKN